VHEPSEITYHLARNALSIRHTQAGQSHEREYAASPLIPALLKGPILKGPILL
jgi:hypothetical protein